MDDGDGGKKVPFSCWAAPRIHFSEKGKRANNNAPEANKNRFDNVDDEGDGRQRRWATTTADDSVTA